MKMFFILKNLARFPIIGVLFKILYKFYCLMYGAAIPISINLDRSNKFPHGIHGIFISKDAIIGENNTIFHHVTIGSNQIVGHKNYGAPVIGNNCIIGAGAKIIGGVTIGNNVNIASNCSISRNLDNNVTAYTMLNIVVKKKL